MSQKLRAPSSAKAPLRLRSLGLRVAMAALAFLGCTTTELGAPRAPYALSDDPLLSGTYTYERPEVGSISGCTATLVGPRLVVTAAHCLGYASRTTPGSYGTFEIRRSATDVHRYTIERYVSYGRSVGDDDVSIIRLATAVPAEIATPAGLAATRPATGTPVTIYGYGCQTRGTSGRWAKQSLRTTWGARTTNLCPGDSGGPTMTHDGLVVRINSGYYLDSIGADIFGIIPVVYPQIERQAAAWGDTIGSGAGMPAPDGGMSGGDGGIVVRDAGPTPRDAGTITPPPPIGDGPCARATCDEATALPGCGWCDATSRGIRVGAYGEALEPCASGYRLNPEDCGATAQSTCGPWTGIETYTCRRGRTQFVRCVEGGTPEYLTCPSGYYCNAGSTERYCYR